MFSVKQVGKTLVSRSAGTKVSTGRERRIPGFLMAMAVNPRRRRERRDGPDTYAQTLTVQSFPSHSSPPTASRVASSSAASRTSTRCVSGPVDPRAVSVQTLPRGVSFFPWGIAAVRGGSHPIRRPAPTRALTIATRVFDDANAWLTTRYHLPPRFFSTG